MSNVRHKPLMTTNRPPLLDATPPHSDADMAHFAELVETAPEFADVRSVSEDVDALAGECIT